MRIELTGWKDSVPALVRLLAPEFSVNGQVKSYQKFRYYEDVFQNLGFRNQCPISLVCDNVCHVGIGSVVPSYSRGRFYEHLWTSRICLGLDLLGGKSMIVTLVILFLLAMIVRIEVALSEAFSDPLWMDGLIWEEEESIYEDNSEWSWGRNIKNYMEE